jgi:hypothetical protein
MGIRRAAWVLIATAIIGCDAPTVPVDGPAYDPRLFNPVIGEDQIFHWPLGKAIRVYVDTAEGGAALIEPVRQGREAWRSVVYYREFDLVLVSSPAMADVIIHTVSAPLLWTLPAGCDPPSGGAGGVTYLCGNETGDEAVILPLNSGGPGHVKIDVTIDPSRATGPFTVRSLVAHELGHVLGIGTHSSNSEDLMAGAPTALVPTERDARTLRYLLHQPVDLRL